ncbi:MAG: hypothetical protein ACMVP2_19660 [Imperialibacter sp.]|uniref:Uncharacterized protein n=1 Tax=Imperialibacter roseus TaxID=1324217 RepID=A0ABZ0IU75_9BACT|nr:hypothetical protein [Imperialibacter roseus]WOK07959.1 hypothetical protein RT717_04860 [Imperialibacter roseus]|tara:strand:+ start:9891 stop:10364 length:474 start_codon:yes stop_codon:yes gene_type:complete
MPKTLLLLSLVTLLCFPLRAQQPYLLFHKSNTREAQYFAGEVIAFRIKDNDFKVTDQIKGFRDGLVLFDGYEVHPNDFEVLYTDQKTRAWFAFGYKFVKLTMIAGAGYLALDVINTGRFDKNTMIISGSLIGAGLIGRLFIREKFKIKGKKKMVVIE